MKKPIDSRSVLYSRGKNDECNTLPYGVFPIIKYIPKGSVIWCPFDKDNSNFVVLLKEAGFKVINSHISYGQDFFAYEPDEHWDCIVSNPPFCFDTKTEVFTKRGWLSYNQINIEDFVLSVNPFTQEIEWSSIDDINIAHYSGNMLHFHTKTINQCVTSNHSMYAYKRDSKCLAIKRGFDSILVSASDVNTNYIQPRSGYKWKGNNIDVFTLPAAYVSNGHTDILHTAIDIPIKDWVAFFGLWLADGCCRHTLNSNKKQRYTVSIKQSQNNEDYVMSILNKLPFNISVYKNKSGNHNYEIHNKQLWSYLCQFGRSRDKFIPQFIKDCNVDILKTLLDNYIIGDSYISRYKNRVAINLSSVSKQLIDDFQEILLKLGFVTQVRCNITKYKEKDYPIYSIFYNKDNICNSKFPKSESVNYDGIVWCPELSINHVMLIRREGTISFTGNTNKRKIFERALSFNKPFALLMSNTWLNDAAPVQLFMDKQLQLLLFDKRMKFLNNGRIDNKITFSTSYYCHKLLPKDLICEHLDTSKEVILR